MHVGSLRQVTRKKAKRLRDGYWRQVTVKTVLQGEGKQSLRRYVDRRHVTVVEWVALWPIFDVFVRETGYEGGGKLQVPWWGQEA